VGGINKVMKLLSYIVVFIILLFISNNLLVYIYPPSLDEMVGKYQSKFKTNKYILELQKDGLCIFTIYDKDNNIINIEKYLYWKIEYQKVRNFPEYILDCNNKTSGIETIISRSIIDFDIKILNIGNSFKYIDPDYKVYFKKEME
jgi:hypothetical protein